MSDKYQTLHAHTTTSDGKLSHFEVLDICAKYNIGVVAFTDHDSLPTKKTIDSLKKTQHETNWIIGIEISSEWPTDIGSGATSGLHIVGLFVDPFNKSLLKHCKLAQEARVVRMQRIVKNLQSIGFDISENDCLKASGGEAVGRPHIVEALKSKQSNLQVIENLRLKMKNDSENNLKIKQKYEEMMRDGEYQYPYTLFLSENSYIPEIYVNYQYHSDMDKSVSLIRNAGGVAVLAHWFTCIKKLNEKVLDKVLLENRLDGVETVYGLGVKGLDIKSQQKILKKLVKKHGKIESGGADAHSQEDFELFSKEGWYSKRTIGMVEKIIEKTKVDTTWSSFAN